MKKKRPDVDHLPIAQLAELLKSEYGLKYYQTASLLGMRANLLSLYKGGHQTPPETVVSFCGLLLKLHNNDYDVEKILQQLGAGDVRGLPKRKKAPKPRTVRRPKKKSTWNGVETPW